MQLIRDWLGRGVLLGLLSINGEGRLYVMLQKIETLFETLFGSFLYFLFSFLDVLQ
jgi:hypothetical protein